MDLKSRREYRRRRHIRVRKKISGTGDRPRMSIMISNKHMYVQFVDDSRAVTLASASTLRHNGGNNIAAARSLGRRAVEVAAGKGIRNVVVDRGGFKFHGRLKAIVDVVADAGLVTGTVRRNERE